jgi:hypothetical protein
MKSIAQKLHGPVAQGLNGAFEVKFPMGVTLVFGGAPFVMAGMTHLNRDGTLPYRVKCATEIQAPAEVEVPCQDFGVPSEADMRAGVRAAITAAFQGQPVFAGCMGGIGRTGTFYAVVLKVLCPQFGFTEDGFVKAVKKLYLTSAVETGQQYDLIDEIYVDDLRAQVKWLWLKAVIRQLLTGR